MKSIDWYTQARFGMFIHWGIYSLLRRSEWVMDEEHIPLEEYSKLADRFSPRKFDAQEWVAMARNAGMKYMVFTSKHHDGYCMFDSKLTDYTSMNSPCKRDFVGELTEECHRQDIAMFYYYSQLDWHHPAYQPSRKPGSEVSQEYIDYYRGQVRELCTNYGKIAGIWFDGEWDHTYEQWKTDEVIAMIRQLQPDALVNDRLGSGKRGNSGDFSTAEQYVPTAAPEIRAPDRPWETNMTMNDNWSYFHTDHNWKTTRQLIHNLARCIAANGNFLLNIGPRPDGAFPPQAVARLEQIGQWISGNGDAIYGAGSSPFGRDTLGVWTAKGKNVYLHAFRWPGREIAVAEIAANIKSVRLLATGQDIPFERRGERVFLTNLPAGAPDPSDSVVVFEMDSVQSAASTAKKWN